MSSDVEKPVRTNLVALPDEPIAELSQANAELEVLAEELRVQNDELATLRDRLEAERRRYSHMFDFAPDGYLVTSLAGIIQEANRASAVLLSAEPGQLVGTPLARYVAEEELPLFYRHLGRLAGKEQWTETWEIRMRSLEGQVFGAALAVASPGQDLEEPALLYWRFQDVSERKKVEEERERLLVQVEEQRDTVETLIGLMAEDWEIQQTIMENTATCLAYIDREFRVQRINLAYARQWGHTEQEVLGENPFQLLPGEENRALLERVRDTGRPAFGKARQLQLPGESGHKVSYWDWSLVPVRDTTGAVKGMVLSLSDVTEEMAAQQRIEEVSAAALLQAEQMDATFEAMVESVVVYDGEGRLVRANRAAAAIYGLNLEGMHREQVIGRLNLRHPDGRPV
ncbi:MAG TPA: PAS domain S-box protein, partial [Anaerolineae bacterium]|nr:PAS domain S-box protein [Anaerolineae bacterium]